MSYDSTQKDSVFSRISSPAFVSKIRKEVIVKGNILVLKKSRKQIPNPPASPARQL